MPLVAPCLPPTHSFPYRSPMHCLVQLLGAAIRAADMETVQELLPRLAAVPLLGFGVLQAACCGCAGSFSASDR